MTKFILSIFTLFIFSIHICFAQNIKGKVKDSSNNISMAFVSVIIKGTRTGTFSDIDGNFNLQNTQKKVTLVFSYTGYQKKEYTWSTDSIAPLNVTLLPESNDLEAIIISNGENPAFRIIRKMQANKDINNPEKINSFTYNSYTLSALKAGPQFWKLGLMKQGNKSKTKKSDDQDTTNISVKKMLIKRLKDNFLFVSEAYSKKIYKAPGLSKETILATKFSGFKEAPLAITATNFQPFGFYNDYIYMNNDSYLSPVANGSISFYSFELKQIIPHNTDTSFVISFMPKDGKNFNGLKGLFYINSDGYAIENVTARPTDEKNHSLNFSLQQKYEKINDKWFPVQLNATLDQKELKNDSILLSWNSRTYISNIIYNAPLDNEDFQDVSISYLADAGMKKDSLWQMVRPDTTDTRAMNTYQTYIMLPPTIKKVFNGVTYILKVATLGAIPLGKVDLPLNYFICGINRYELYRFGAGFQTNGKFNKTVSVGGFAGYGLGDKSWKYGGNIKLYTHEDRRSFFTLQYKQDLKETGIVPYFEDNYSLYSFQTVRNFLASQFDSVRLVQLKYESRIGSNITTDLWLNNENRHPAGYNYSFIQNSKTYTGYTNTEAGIGINIHKGEKYSKIGNAKILTGLANTQLLVQATTSLPGFANGELHYQKVALQFTKRIQIKRFGETQIDFTTGKIWGNVPYGYLFNTQAAYVKGGVSYIPFHFQTVGLYEFASDQFAALFLQHDFGHLLFKPKNIHFQPRLLLVQNIEYGSLNHPEYQQKITLSSPNQGLFESGIMLANIYRQRLFSLFYLGVGGGVFYRYGAYALPRAKDNMVFKFGFNFSQ